MGANGYRTAHYPHHAATMDYLDELGFLVMDETRWFETTPDGIRQLEMLVKRDRNRPGVIFWSLGNEEPMHIRPEGRRIALALRTIVRRLDPTRPVTTAQSVDPLHSTVLADMDVIGVNYKKEELKYGLWETIEQRVFPGSVSNHHLGTQLGLLMAAYEMNTFKDAYQKAVIENAKSFARALKKEGREVMGDPAVDYTETHQVLVDVGYGTGPEVAERLEENNIIVNYQATPDEEGFTASGALRMGVSEMTRFGFGQREFTELAGLMADCILRGKDVGQEVSRLRSRYTTMHYCFDGPEFQTALEQFMGQVGF